MFAFAFGSSVGMGSRSTKGHEKSHVRQTIAVWRRFFKGVGIGCCALDGPATKVAASALARVRRVGFLVSMTTYVKMNAGGLPVGRIPTA